MADRKNHHKRAKRIVDSIIESERINEAWDKDMMAPPLYPRKKLIADLNKCGSVALDVLLEVLGSGDGLARQQAAYLIDRIEHDEPERVSVALGNAASKKGPGQWAAARALARRDITKAVEHGLHLDQNTRRGVLPSLPDGAERTAALDTLFQRGDRRALVDALRYTTPDLLSNPAIHAHVVFMLDDKSIGLAHAAGLLLCQAGDDTMETFIEAACKQPRLLGQKIVRLIVNRPAASKLIVPLVLAIPAKTGHLENAHSAHLVALLQAHHQRGDEFSPEVQDVIVARLSEALARRPSVRPKSWDVLGRLMLAAGLIGDHRLVKPLIDIITWDGGHGGALRTQLWTALASYPKAATVELNTIIESAENTEFARSLAKDVLAHI